MKRVILFLWLAALVRGTIIPTAQTTDWTISGVTGGIPLTRANTTTLSTAGGNDSTDNKTTIQNALNALTSGQVLYIPAGIYRISGDLAMPSNVTLRGAGNLAISASSVAVGTGTKVFTVAAGLDYQAGVQVLVRRSQNSGGMELDNGTYMQGSVTSYSGTTLTLNITASADGKGSGTYATWLLTLTVLKTTGTGSGAVTFGTTVSAGYQSPNMVAISSGATAGSTSIVVASATGITTGTFLIVSELNDSEVALTGAANTPTNATWVDGWTTNVGVGLGTRARGQIVQVTNVSGTTLTITPSLYTAYTLTPTVLKFTSQCTTAGVENLCVYATNTGSVRNFYMQNADNCWVYNCMGDFTDGDHCALDWCYRCEVRRSYFDDAFSHTSGTYDTQVGLRYKTSCALITDNICYRLHVSIMTEWGAAGNVIAYNYTAGEYDDSIASGNRWLAGGVSPNHGANPQFNLWEGNIATHMIVDAYWGSSTDQTFVRNWFLGHGTAYLPASSRGTPQSPLTLNQDTQALEVWEGQLRVSAVGNILGDSTMATGTFKVTTPTTRNYGPASALYIWTIGYTGAADTGSVTPILTSPTASLIDHGNYDFVNAAQTWMGGIADHIIPTSYYLAGLPSWFGNLTWPAFNPALPGTPAVTKIPAGYRFVNAAEPPPFVSTSGSIISGNLQLSGNIKLQ